MLEDTREPSPQQWEFIRQYGECFNATEAARRAGYSDPNYGRQLKGFPHIARHIPNLRRPKRLWRTRHHHVYLIREEAFGAIKIGISVIPANRFNTLQLAFPYDLALVFSAPVGDETKAREIEKNLHQHFAKKRIRGEWFRLSDADVRYATSWLAERRVPCHNSATSKPPLFAST